MRYTKSIIMWGFDRKITSLIIFNALLILGFAIYFISGGNYEFIWYVGVMVVAFALLLGTLKRSNLSLFVLAGLSLWGLMHMAGGGIKIGGEVLYVLHIIPIVGSGESFVLKYDQVVHFIGFGISTVLFYELLVRYLRDEVNYKVLYPLIILGGMGIGALNEVIEFGAVLAVPETGVGGYFNTMIDMVFNTLGAIAAVFFIHYRRKKQEAKPEIHYYPKR